MKKGFISITIIYSFLLVFVFTLLTLLAIYTQKTRLLDSIVYEAKQEMFAKKSLFNYTGGYEIYPITETGYYYIEAYGAQGGNTPSEYVIYLNVEPPYAYYGGKGGKVSGYLYMVEGEKLYIYVGGQGDNTTHASNQTCNGGYNGGGSCKNGSSTGYIATGGGGASDIRYFGTKTVTSNDLLWDSELGLNSRIMVAGGGGGVISCPHCSSTTGTITSGDGGGIEGGTSEGRITGETSRIAHGGGQTGETTMFGKGSFDKTTFNEPGGGGGYYGGDTNSYAAGGGSSFISGYSGCNAITNSNNREPINNPNHYSGKIFERSSMTSGVNEGDGKVLINYIGNSLPEE